MRRFMHKPTDLYSRAVKALSLLCMAEGADAALRAYAEATWEEHQKQYAKKYGLKLSNGRICLARLLGKKCDYHSDHSGIPCRPPGADHDSLWLKDGKPYVYVSQPYGLSAREMRELVSMCDRHGLEAYASAWPSWHFPGAVLTVEIKRKAETGQKNEKENFPSLPVGAGVTGDQKKEEKNEGW